MSQAKNVVWAVLPPGLEEVARDALSKAGIKFEKWPQSVPKVDLPEPPSSLLKRLGEGDRDSWRRYWLAAAIFSVFPTSPAPEGPHPPAELWRDGELLEDLRRAARLGTRLLEARHNPLTPRSPEARHPHTPRPQEARLTETSRRENFQTVGGRLGALWEGHAPEGWIPFSPWGYPQNGSVLYQRKGSVVALLSNTLDDSSSPAELEVHVALGGADKQELAEGTLFELTDNALAVKGPIRDYVLIADGRHRCRLRTSSEVFDLSDAGVEVVHGFSILEQISVEEKKTFRHGNDITPRAPKEGDEVIVRAHGPESYRTHACPLYFHTPTDSGSAPMTAEQVEDPGNGITFSAKLPPQPSGSVVRYRIEARGKGGSEFAQDSNPTFVYPDLEVPWTRPPFDRFSYPVGPHRAPEWVRDAVIYHVLVDRFAAHDGNELLPEEEVPWLGFAGGTVKGLTERLEYIRGLGADVIWVSPIFRSQMHVGYDVEDFFDVHPRLGTLQDARELCDEAHRLGLRVLLDFEPSYIGSQHPFHKAAREAADSPYRQWFHWHRWPDRPFGWFGNRMLVALDHGHPPVRSHLLDASRFWLEIGFDGFRLDSAHGAPLDFWTDFGEAVRNHSPEAFTVGEVMAPLETCLDYEGRLNAFLDFEVCNGIRELLGEGKTTVEKFDALVRKRVDLGEFLPVSFIESHDMDRFTFVSGEPKDARLRAALLLMMALPDVPILYYGTEVGIQQKAKGDIDQTVRPPMAWGTEQDLELKAYTKELISRRREYAALRRGSYKALQTGPGYFFTRTLDRDVVLAGVNPTASNVSLTMEKWPETFAHFGGGRVTRTGDGLEISLGPYESCLVSSL